MHWSAPVCFHWSGAHRRRATRRVLDSQTWFGKGSCCSSFSNKKTSSERFAWTRVASRNETTTTSAQLRIAKGSAARFGMFLWQNGLNDNCQLSRRVFSTAGNERPRRTKILRGFLFRLNYCMSKFMSVFCENFSHETRTLFSLFLKARVENS